MLKVLEVMDILKVVISLGVCLFFGFKCKKMMYEKNRSAAGGFCLGFFLTWVGYIICRCKKYNKPDNLFAESYSSVYNSTPEVTDGKYSMNDFTWWRCSCGNINGNDDKECQYCGESKPQQEI